jgi:hypothetical protein
LRHLPLFGGSYRCLGQLPLFDVVTAVYCESHTEHILKGVRTNVDFMNGEADGIYNYHCVLKASAYTVPEIFQTLAPVETTRRLTN